MDPGYSHIKNTIHRISEKFRCQSCLLGYRNIGCACCENGDPAPGRIRLCLSACNDNAGLLLKYRVGSCFQDFFIIFLVRSCDQDFFISFSQMTDDPGDLLRCLALSKNHFSLTGP